jgi:pyrimidine operon attenuation protein / uracil phosphoribosyltransferase
MSIREKAQVMNATDIDRAVNRLAYEIIELNRGTSYLALVGIRRRGVPLADRLAQCISEREKSQLPVGYLDINLYRDDLSTVATQPIIQKTEINFPISDKVIVLVDDVLYTGRTIRAAMDALLDFGRPKGIQLCVLSIVACGNCQFKLISSGNTFRQPRTKWWKSDFARSIKWIAFYWWRRIILEYRPLQSHSKSL